MRGHCASVGEGEVRRGTKLSHLFSVVSRSEFRVEMLIVEFDSFENAELFCTSIRARKLCFRKGRSFGEVPIHEKIVTRYCDPVYIFVLAIDGDADAVVREGKFLRRITDLHARKGYGVVFTESADIDDGVPANASGLADEGFHLCTGRVLEISREKAVVVRIVGVGRYWRCSAEKDKKKRDARRDHRNPIGRVSSRLENVGPLTQEEGVSLFRILYSSPEFVAIDKPAGIHVHPPEDEQFKISKATNGLALLRDQLGRYVYPVHRLDRATSGVVLYALDSASASKLAGLFAERAVAKVYYALVRGEARLDGVVDSPLAEEGKSEVPALTRYERIGTQEFPWANDRFSTSRYSLLRVRPETGRFHQIRKHLRRENHPIIGDSVHGDGVHNRHWREVVGRPFLFLKAYSLLFKNPFDGLPIEIASSWNSEWLRVFDAMGVCPRTTQPVLPRGSTGQRVCVVENHPRVKV